jgi:hypothetical protein
VPLPSSKALPSILLGISTQNRFSDFRFAPLGVGTTDLLSDVLELYHILAIGVSSCVWVV